MRTALALLLVLAAGPAVAGPREEALTGLANGGDVEVRRRAAVTLAEAGTMADVPALVSALRDADARVRGLAERALWEVWSRSGNEDVDHLLRAGVVEMQHGQLEASIDTFSEVIRLRPDFAEGWNKRATVYYLVGEYRKSAADCDEVLKRNPSHFGALSGYGMIWLRLDEPARALERFEQALAVNPNLDSVRETVEALRALLIQQRRHLTEGTVIDALRKISSPSIANGIETFKIRPRNVGHMTSEIKCLFPDLGPLVGYAVPCVIRAEHEPLQGHRSSTFEWWDYVHTIPAPRVIVVHDIDEPRGQGAQWGEVQANIHKALGCVGVVTDGSVRDLDEVRALGFQFAAAHVSVSHAYVHMVDFGLPVKVGGLWVKPGDLVHADQHGVVTIPKEIAGQVAEAVAKVEADERKIIGVCQSRDFSANKLKDLYKQIRPGTY